MEYPLRDIHQIYTQLILQKEEGLVILWLDEKIRLMEIDKDFTYQDIKQAIQEVSDLEPGSQPQTERILRNLLHHYIERPSSSISRYNLTEYANKFIRLLESKLNNPFQNFPLQESFKRYTNFKADNINNINDLENWFEQGFNNTTRQNIVDHLEVLKDEINKSIQRLNSILHSKEENVLTILLQFTEVFKKLGEKADEISDTLKLGSDLDQNLQQVIDLFYQKVEHHKHPQNEIEFRDFYIIQNQHERSISIKKEVSDFFSLIDRKLNQLREKIIFASTKLSDLQDQFQYQSTFKINLKRFFQFILQEGRYQKEHPILPTSFPRKHLSIESFKMIEIPYNNYLSSSKNIVIQINRDYNYENQQRENIIIELKRQESSASIINKCIGFLNTNKELDLSKLFYEILETEKDINIALESTYELLQFVKNSEIYNIIIDRTIPEDFHDRQVIIWKMIIYREE